MLRSMLWQNGRESTRVIALGPTSNGVRIPAPIPSTTAEAKAASGLATSVAFWRFDRANAAAAPTSFASLGDVAATLTAVSLSSPYQAVMSGRVGMNVSDATGLAANIGGAVLDPGAGSFLAGGSVGFAVDPAGTEHNLMGRYVAGAHICGWRISVNDSGDLKYEFDDDTHTFTGTLAAAIMPLGAEPLDIVVQLDRSGTDPVARFRWSRNGVNIGSTSVTMAGLLTLTKANQRFGFGAIPNGAPAYYAGQWVQYAFCGLGVQAEGATRALLASQGHGWEA